MGLIISLTEVVIRVHVEAVLNLSNILLCLAALLLYFVHRKSTKVVPSFVLFIVCCLIYSVVFSIEAISRLLLYYDVAVARILVPHHPLHHWYSTVNTMCFDSVYATGTFLALDRILVMTLPFAYSSWNLDKKLFCASLGICLLTSTFLIGSNAFFPFHGNVSSFSTEAATHLLGIVYDLIAPIEVLLHVVFSVLYYRFMKRRQSNGTRTRGPKTNQMTLVQGVSQTVFCIFSKMWNRLEVSFTGREIWWMLRVKFYYQFFFAIHIFLTASFIVLKLRRLKKQAVTSVHRVSLMVERTNGRVTAFEEDLRPYLEIIGWLGCISVCFLAVVPYLLFRKNPNFIGSLLFFILSCFTCSVIHATQAVARILDMSGLVDGSAILDGDWFFLCQTTSIDFIYIGGTVLALDRVLVMTFPSQYSSWGVSRKLCLLAALFSLLVAALLFGTNAFRGYKGDGVHFSTVVALKKVGVVFDVLAVAEFLLHVVFCIQYRIFAKRANIKPKALKANQVAFVQGISQITFCLLPKFLNRISTTFSSQRIPWIDHVTWYYQFSFALHVFVTCSFMVYKMQFMRRTKVVVSIPRNSAYTSKT
ncbi:hypothetical protein QR680_008889 [Steinernema hermaphroditum]|uniref:Uncharacterized protein n=1 Tax=Steinernema hermaphroditum TaxID=289476 RepID=A0AA39IIA0_9BILA|nr:hypothetical protein QR680_008889 [Steinernema hermaphroditum]